MMVKTLLENCRKKQFKDYWNDREIILGVSKQEPDMLAIGEVIDKNTDRWIHIKVDDMVKFLKEHGKLEAINMENEPEEDVELFEETDLFEDDEDEE